MSDTLNLKEYLEQKQVVFFDLESETANPIDRWLAGWLETQNRQREYVSCITNYTAGAGVVAHTDTIMTLPYGVAIL